MSDKKKREDTTVGKDKPESKATEGKPGIGASWLPLRRSTYILIVIAVSALIIVWNHFLSPNARDQAGVQIKPLADGSTVVGKPKIGGPFTMLDQDGRTVTEADFAGRYMLVYFGYTYCPDVCPTSLSVMADALDVLGAKADKIVPVFVTVDPERDIPEFLKEYIVHFHPRLVGLTGTPEQVAKMAKAYKVFYQKVGDGYGDGDYLMDHSSITYLIGPDGQFISHFGHGTGPETIAEQLARLVE